MNELLLPPDLLAATMNYLAERPYREVAGLIQRLSSLPRAPEQSKSEAESAQPKPKRT